jgi:uncharacterized membrane protein YhfC
MMGLPIVLGLMLIRWYGVRWRTFFLGGATFVVSQVGHLPFNNYILNPFINQNGWQFEIGEGLLILAVLVGLSAGVFEESARWIFMRLWLKVRPNWRNGLMFGAGHGGTEAMLTGVLVFYTFLQAAVVRGMDVNTLGTPEEVEVILAFMNTYWSYPSYYYLLGALERVSAMAFHLSATLLVLRALQRKNPLFWLAAIAWHTVTNTIAVYGSVAWGILWTEAALLGVGTISIGIVFLLRDEDRQIADDELPSVESGEAPALETLKPAEIDPADLEGSRYD